jgi:uncharacterized membrane protein
MGKLDKDTVDKEFQGQVRAVQVRWPSSVAKFGGTVIKTSLSDEDQKDVQDVLHGESTPREAAGAS